MERKSVRPVPSLYRMNRAASMRLEESKKKVSVTREVSLRKTIRKPRRYSYRKTSSSVAPAASSQSGAGMKKEDQGSLRAIDESALRVPLISTDLSLPQQQPRGQGHPYTVQLLADSRVDACKEESGIIASLVKKPIDKLVSAHSLNSSFIEKNEKAEIIHVSEILLPEYDENPIKNIETKVDKSGWRVVDCLKALKNTLFREGDASKSVEEREATQSGKRGDSVSVDSCQRSRIKCDRKPVITQTDYVKIYSLDGGLEMLEPSIQGSLAGSLAIQKAERRNTLPQASQHTPLGYHSVGSNLPPVGQTPSTAPPSPASPQSPTNQMFHVRRVPSKVRQSSEAARPQVLHPPPVHYEAEARDLSQSSPVGHSFQEHYRRLAKHPPPIANPPSVPQPSLPLTDSLELLEGRISRLERERCLEAIRRLEQTAAIKRQELSSTRERLRLSLKEEMENNRKLEIILAKIRAIRKAGEKGAFRSLSRISFLTKKQRIS